MNSEQEIQKLKGRIAEVYARRERLKGELEAGALSPRDGFVQLDEVDRELSGLDSRFKALWDATQAETKDAAHPAILWARSTLFTPLQLDCITAIMLKTLDGKCKMGQAEKQALAAVYDVVKGRDGQGLDEEVHALIAAFRRGDSEVAEQIHHWRLRAEAYIPKPEMKAFKQLLRSGLPLR